MMLKIRVNKGGYLCKEVANRTMVVCESDRVKIYSVSFSACFLFFLFFYERPEN